MKKPKLQKSSLQLTKIAASQTNWTRKEIIARQELLAKLCVETWPRKP